MKINWTLVSLAAAAILFMKKKSATAAAAAPAPNSTDVIKAQVITGDIDTGTSDSWVPSTGS